ncbi:MAG: cellulase family glycosylhydrolase [Alphaproteobacteria bacterium]|nr:cellulase family glycosylhydrolase [Alphaproteobacteria bacterium]
MDTYKRIFELQGLAWKALHLQRCFVQMVVKPFLFVLVAALFSSNAYAQPALHRGVNLSSWFANAPRQPLTMRDFKNIKDLGFDFVRLPINPEIIGFRLNGAPGKPQNLDLHEIEIAVQGLTQVGLAVVLDVHPESDFMADLERGGYAEDQFIGLWKMLAEAFHKYPKDQVAFELLNEPQYYGKSGRYNAFIGKVVRAVRETEPDRLLIVCAPGVVSLEPADALEAMQVVPDANIAYDVHYYLPYIVSHQGMPSFTEKEIRNFRSVPYPSALVDKEAVKRALAPGAKVYKAMGTLDSYVKEDWDAARIASFLAPVAAWSKKNSARVLVLEFGALRMHIDPASRYRWIKDVRKALDSGDLGWAYWDYTDGFGFMTLLGKTVADPDGAVRFENPSDAKNLRRVDSEAVDALGLAQSLTAR